MQYYHFIKKKYVRFCNRFTIKASMAAYKVNHIVHNYMAFLMGEFAFLVGFP